MPLIGNPSLTLGALIWGPVACAWDGASRRTMPLIGNPLAYARGSDLGTHSLTLGALIGNPSLTLWALIGGPTRLRPGL